MQNYLIIPDQDGTKHYYQLSFTEDHRALRIYLENVCVIDIYKNHDHNYDFKYFFYKTKRIGYLDHVPSKKELHKQLELILKNHLYPYIDFRPG